MEGPKKEHLDVLKAYFGHKEFKACQWDIISSILYKKRDNCVVMATGYGKSLCYQFPPVLMNGTAFVISPLISLMQDQMRNIPATFFGSAQKSHNEQHEVLQNKFRVVYLTPEWCSSENAENFFKDVSEKVNLVLIAIDEAHCVSQWGMDFRPAYRKLGLLRNLLPKVPFLTVTATANLSVREDICASLNLRNPLITITSLDRPNLFLSASVKGDDIVMDVYNLMLSCKYFQTPGSCIIYVPTKKAAENIATKLQSSNLSCATYHADLSLSVRQRVHEDFAKDKISLIVATVAFGMGIDKPDVRLIIHYGAPKEIESYYQEIGRAGRDGLPATCHVFYSRADFNLNKFFLQHLTGKFRAHKEEMVKIMERYLITSDCRRFHLIKHFDPAFKKEVGEKCCDSCLKEKYQKKLEYDLTADILRFLQALVELKGNYGITMTVKLLRGSFNKRLPQQYLNHKLFGAGRHKPEDWWKLLGNLLILEGLIDEKIINTNGYNKNNFPMKTVQISSKGRQYLFNEEWRQKIKIQPTPEMLKCLAMPSKDGWYRAGQNYDAIIPNSQCDDTKSLEEFVFKDLVAFRSKIAKSLDCMPHMLFNNKTAQILAHQRPENKTELSFIEGLTNTSIEKFGQACIDCIKCSILKHKSLDDSGPRNNKRFVKKQKRALRYDGDEEETSASATSTSEFNDSESLSVKDGDQSFFEEDDDAFDFNDDDCTVMPPEKKQKEDSRSSIIKKLNENEKKKKLLMSKIKL